MRQREEDEAEPEDGRRKPERRATRETGENQRDRFRVVEWRSWPVFRGFERVCAPNAGPGDRPGFLRAGG